MTAWRRHPAAAAAHRRAQNYPSGGGSGPLFRTGRKLAEHRRKLPAAQEAQRMAAFGRVRAGVPQAWTRVQRARRRSAFAAT